jgi:transposase
MTYSLDFRKKVFDVKTKKALTFEETSQHFDVPIRTLFRWQRQLEPQTHRNKPATKINSDELTAHVDKNPDAYLWERAKHFNVTPQAIFFALRRLGISYKKNAQTSQSQRASAHRLSTKDK